MRRACSYFLFLLPVATGVAASESPAPSGVAELDTVVISATHTERPLRYTAGTVTVITDEDIEAMLAQDIGDLVRYEPGLSVTSDAARFGLGGFEIRGIGGNRVLTEIDGVPVSDAFAIGAFSNAGRDFVDPEVLKRVEILRGSASALYGSDAIGGVVTFTTKDPVDYLRGDGAYTAGKIGYNSVDTSTVASVISAFGDERNGWLFAYTRRDGHERDNQGDNSARDSTRTAPNPQDYSADNLLAKGVFVRGNDTFRVTLDAHRGETQTEVLSSLATQDYSAIYGIPYLVQTEAMRGDDTQQRTRLSGEWEFARNAGLFDTGRALVYAQQSVTKQETFERRTTTVFGMPASVIRERVFDFEQEAIGANLLLRKSFVPGAGPEHLLVYGIELEHADTVQQRDGAQTDIATGDTTNVVSPDVFPVRDFPPSTTLEAGIYLQDEIRWNDLTLIPGVRLDHYRLDPDSTDPVFVADNPGIAPVEIDETNLSPKLGTLYDFDERWTGFFHYAHGFRAPPYNDVNVGFTNLAFGYTAIPNPDLKPETSDSFELGVRRAGARSGLSVVVFHNRYDDFVEPFVGLGVDPETGLLVFQSQNITSVTTEGVELKAHYDLAALEGLRLTGSLAYAEGENDETGQPLNSIAPATAVLGVGYAAPSGIWGMELVGTLAAEKDDVDESAGALFTPAGYAKFDLLGWYAFTPDVRLNYGVFNLADTTYWNWSNVRGRPADDVAIDRYTAPGINASAALRVTF